jgi:hypothetical protein
VASTFVFYSALSTQHSALSTKKWKEEFMAMREEMSGEALAALIERVFLPRASDHALAVLVDLPDHARADSAEWRERREMAAQWVRRLVPLRQRLGLDVHLYLYRNVRTNNADLPYGAWLHASGPLPGTADKLDPLAEEPFAAIFQAHSLLVAITELSATAPLKLMARTFAFRAATMPGFSPAMIPALRLDYEEINRRVIRFKELLDRAEGAELVFTVDDGPECKLSLDLRHRTAHASSGLLHEPGTAGNLPSGEAYIVPYEGEIEGAPSASTGQLPVQFGSEVVIYEIDQNRAIRATGPGPAARQEAEHLVREPAYGNIAELGLGILSDYGVKPCGSLLLDEKLGLHIAFGRSDHFGGRVGAAQFSRPEEVVHIDRVYLPSVQPLVHVRRVDLCGPGLKIPLMRDDRFVVDLGVS